MLAIGVLHMCNNFMFFSLLCSLPACLLVMSAGVPLSHSFQPSVSGGMRCVLREHNSKGLVFVGFLRMRVTM